jgi:hypothetical protein
VNDIIAAIQAKFTALAGTTFAGIVGGLWTDVPPPDGSDVPRPYAILYDLTGGRTLHDFSRGIVDPYAVQFAVEATGKQLADSLIEIIDSVYGPSELVVASPGTAIFLMFNRRYPLRSYVDPTARDESGQNVWRAVAVYDVMVQTS